MEEKQMSHQWEEVVVEPHRLRSGLWGYEEGDISQSYSADVYGMHKKIRKPFTHASQFYVSMGSATGGCRSQPTSKAYPLLHENYHESVMQEFTNAGLHSGYVGEPVIWKGDRCIFGLPAIFKQRVLTDDERVDLLRRMYAYGGMFAIEAGSYQCFLLDEKEKDTAFGDVIMHEMYHARANNLVTQQNLRDLIESNLTPDSNSDEQLSLF